jgi:hypothetical protein
VAQARQRIAEICAPYDARHVIACAIALCSFADSSYQESAEESSLALEHVVSVMLEREHPHPAAPNSNSSGVLAATRRSYSLAQQAVTATAFMSWDSMAATEDPIGKLTALFQVHDATLRGPGYEIDEKALLLALFSAPVQASDLETALGFNIDDALAFEDAVTKILERRANAFRLSDAELGHSSLVKKLAITPQAIAKEADRDITRAEAFLDAFALDFAHTVTGGAMLWGNSDIRMRPLVRCPDGRFLSTSGTNLLWAIRPRLEEALKAQPHWNSHQSNRTKVIEDRVQQALETILDPDHVWANIAYDITGVGTGYEADRLLIVDDLLLVVEVKAGDFSPSTLSGRARDLRRDLEVIVGKGSRQTGRLAEACRHKRPIHFYDVKTKAPIAVPIHHVARVEQVVITLRDLAWFHARPDLLAHAGLIPTRRRMPWIASIYDLATISELVEYPSQFTRYLTQRRLLPLNVSSPGDEVNVWMIYMEAGLSGFPRDREVVLTRSKLAETMDTYRMFGKGSPPSMALSRNARGHLADLQASRPHGWISQGETVIENEQQGRRPVFQDMRSLLASADRELSVQG